MLRNPLAGRGQIYSPLLWLAQRLGKNRERLGVHYPSDTFGSRHLAGAIWRAVLHDGSVECPTLRSVLNHAIAYHQPSCLDLTGLFAFEPCPFQLEKGDVLSAWQINSIDRPIRFKVISL